MSEQVELWDKHEISLEGPEEANPFSDVSVRALFSGPNRQVVVSGFYDGNGVYRIRFMPDALGRWDYVTESDRPELAGESGSFTCVEPSPENRGPVSVSDTYHFAYADGTTYIPIGTTCYTWTHQTADLQDATLETLRSSPFNKLRMCVFPFSDAYNRNEPVCYPFERTEEGNWDSTRFNPEFFQRIEERLDALLQLGIQADVILFHPYDRWGFSSMDAEADARYVRYVVARLAAYRNIWWSLANEYDWLVSKTMEDWDRLFRIVQESDPYGHLRSIHNSFGFYDHSKPWVTHASIQTWDVTRAKDWRVEFRKPIILDEVGYEGDVKGFGDFIPEEIVRRTWTGVACGAYVSHGEAYYNPEEILWYSKGGDLGGESPSRIAFLRDILEGFSGGLEPTKDWEFFGTKSKDGDYLIYLETHRPRKFVHEIHDDGEYLVDIIDTWAMEVTTLERLFRGIIIVELPHKPFLALRIYRK